MTDESTIDDGIYITSSDYDKAINMAVDESLDCPFSVIQNEMEEYLSNAITTRVAFSPKHNSGDEDVVRVNIRDAVMEAYKRRLAVDLKTTVGKVGKHWDKAWPTYHTSGLRGVALATIDWYKGIQYPPKHEVIDPMAKAKTKKTTRRRKSTRTVTEN